MAHNLRLQIFMPFMLAFGAHLKNSHNYFI